MFNKLINLINKAIHISISNYKNNLNTIEVELDHRIALIKKLIMYEKAFPTGDFQESLNYLISLALDELNFVTCEFYRVNRVIDGKIGIKLEASHHKVDDIVLVRESYTDDYSKGKQIDIDHGEVFFETIRKGGAIVIDPFSDARYISQSAYNGPCLMIRVTDKNNNPVGIIKFDMGDANKEHDYDQLMETLSFKQIYLSRLARHLTTSYENETNGKLHLEPILESAVRAKYKLDAVKRVAHKIRNAPYHGLEIISEMILNNDDFHFSNMRSYLIDNSTGVVSAGYAWDKGRNIKKYINTSSKFWNNFKGRIPDVGEILWESTIRRGRGIIVLDPKADIRCRVKMSFADPRPAIYIPTENGILKIDGEPISSNDDMDIMHMSLYFKERLLTALSKETKLQIPEVDQEIASQVSFDGILPDLRQLNIAYGLTLKEIIDQVCDKFDAHVERIFSSHISSDQMIDLISDMEIYEKVLTKLIPLRMGYSRMFNSLFFALQYFIYSDRPQIHNSTVNELLKIVLYLSRSGNISHRDGRNLFNLLNDFQDKTVFRDVSIQSIDIVSRLFSKTGEISDEEFIDFFRSLIKSTKFDSDLVSALSKSVSYFVKERQLESSNIMSLAVMLSKMSEVEEHMFNPHLILAISDVVSLSDNESIKNATAVYLMQLLEKTSVKTTSVDTAIVIGLSRIRISAGLTDDIKRDISEILQDTLHSPDIIARQVAMDAMGLICMDLKIPFENKKEYIRILALQLNDKSLHLQERAMTIIYAIHQKLQSNDVLALLNDWEKNRIGDFFSKQEDVIATSSKAQISSQTFKIGDLEKESKEHSIGGKGEGLDEFSKQLKEAIVRIGREDLLDKIFIPEAFVLEDTLYKNFVRHNSLMDDIEKILSVIDFDQDIDMLNENLHDAYFRINNLFMMAELPFNTERELLLLYNKLQWYAREKGIPFEGVAIRSSSSDEDKEDSAAAGRYLTHVAITDKERLIRSLKRVWASLWSPEAILHRHNFNQNAVQPTMAAIIQNMAPDIESSGVIVVQKNQDGTLTVEINGGLGLECGTRDDDNTDYYKLVVDQNQATLVKTKIYPQKFKHVPKANSSTDKVILSDEEAMAQKVSDESLETLALISSSLSEILNKDLDIEFTVSKDGTISFIQQRKFTGAYNKADIYEKDIVSASTDYLIQTDNEYFMNGIGSGETVIIKGGDRHSRADIIKRSKGKVIIADHLDETNLHKMLINSPPAGIVIESGSKYSHAAIEANELARIHGIYVPVIHMPHATEIFESIQKVAVVAHNEKVSFFLEDSRDEEIVRSRVAESDIYAKPVEKKVKKKRDIPFQFNSDNIIRVLESENIEQFEMPELTIDNAAETVIDLSLAAQTIRNDMLDYFDTFAQTIDPSDHADIWTFLVSYTYKGQKMANYNYEKYNMSRKVDDEDDSEKLISYAGRILRINELVAEIKQEYNIPDYVSDATKFYCFDPKLHKVVPQGRVFMINPESFQIIEGETDVDLIGHDKIAQMLPVDNELLIRGNTADFGMLGVYSNKVYDTAAKQLEVMGKVAAYLIKIGFDPDEKLEFMMRDTHEDLRGKTYSLKELASNK